MCVVLSYQSCGNLLYNNRKLIQILFTDSISGHITALAHSESNSQAAIRWPGAVLGLALPCTGFLTWKMSGSKEKNYKKTILHQVFSNIKCIILITTLKQKRDPDTAYLPQARTVDCWNKDMHLLLRLEKCPGNIHPPGEKKKTNKQSRWFIA